MIPAIDVRNAGIGTRAHWAKVVAGSSSTLTFFLSFDRGVHILAVTVQHGPGVRDRSFLSSAEAADTLYLTCALVLDLRHERSYPALGRIHALIARFATTSLETKCAEDFVLEVRIVA